MVEPTELKVMTPKLGPRANRPRGAEEYVDDTLRKLDLAVDEADRQSARLGRAARDARRAAERMRRMLAHLSTRLGPDTRRRPPQRDRHMDPLPRSGE
jgi:hypothetical protein